MTKYITAFIATACLAGLAFAEEDETFSEAHQANRAKSEAHFAANQKQYAGNPDFWVARGLLADRKARTVTLDSYTTGVGPNDISEFFIISENSGHDYESLFGTFAQSEDICKALEFIGVPRGRAVDYDKLVFWPKGERLLGTVIVGTNAPVPLDSLMYSTETKQPLTNTGFIYIGDRRDASGRFLGDSAGPGSVISSYNESYTVLDVPRLAAQSEVYEKYTVSSNLVKAADVWCTITLTPEPRPADSPKRVRDVSIEFLTNSVALDGANAGPLKDALQKLQGYAQAGQDVYATPTWSDELTLSQMRDFCKVLKIVDVEGGIRIEPPAAGDPYYKSFLPNEDWRNRANRFSQPCELHLEAAGAATVVAIAEIWKDDALKPELKITEIPGVTVQTLPQVLKSKGPDLPVLLIFAPGTMKYGQMKPFVKAVQTTHPSVHIFID